VPVLGLPLSDGLAVIASNYGQERHPSWYYNLRANPTGEVDFDGVKRRFRATEARGEERDRIWQQGLRVYPGWSAVRAAGVASPDRDLRARPGAAGLNRRKIAFGASARQE